ncbi:MULTISPECIES: enolase C-terminal domain-like protein [Streptacidiphilus]|uniref:glucarate dehydratase n=1 Tax=Streptacidiphilus cavernicola TaxID=3342716 RepID=A0ABV6UMJ3_9ACTN|nr:enolase C-terminal domain-like protein [Streptacidiphilus jeojiense]
MSETLQLRLHRAAVSWRTTWWVVTLTASDGCTGLGESSDAGPGARRVWAEVDALLREGATVEETIALLGEGRSDGDPATDADGDDPRRASNPDRATATARARATAPALARATVGGALEQALTDLRARRQGRPLWQVLGAEEARPVHRYANINRALRTRTPDDFARTAAAAEAAGYTAVKCAPFDGLPPALRLREGLARARAVRRALRPSTALMVDAHLLLGLDEVLTAAPALAALDLRWLEDAVALDDAEGLAAVHAAGIAPLAGGEFATGPAQVRAALRSGHLGWLLPDVKHSGGYAAALRLADEARAVGVRVSLHNPSGPVATAAGLHLAAACGPDAETEFAFGEASWRGRSVTPAEPADGAWMTPPQGAGLGIDLDHHWQAHPLPHLDGAA